MATSELVIRGEKKMCRNNLWGEEKGRRESVISRRNGLNTSVEKVTRGEMLWPGLCRKPERKIKAPEILRRGPFF
jgi:hypothetical protein